MCSARIWRAGAGGLDGDGHGHPAELWQERLALAIGMWPRGEVGAGVLIVSLGYGLGGPMITAAMLSLALNLVLTGVFILLVQWLVAGDRILARADLVSSVHPREQ